MLPIILILRIENIADMRDAIQAVSALVCGLKVTTRTSSLGHFMSARILVALSQVKLVAFAQQLRNAPVALWTTSYSMAVVTISHPVLKRYFYLQATLFKTPPKQLMKTFMPPRKRF